MIVRWPWAAALFAGALGLAWLSWSSRRPLQGARAQSILEHPAAEAWELRLERGGAPIGRLISVHIDPNTARPRLVLNRERRRLQALAPGADLVANAGFFTPEFRPTGLLVSEGELLHPFIDHGGSAGTGVLVWRDSGEIRLFRRSRFELAEPSSIRIAIQAGPRLIEPRGEPGIRSDDRIGSNRTVVGRDRAGRFVVAVAHATPRGSGPSLWEMMTLLGADGLGSIRDDLALDLALNLDGGPSAGLHVPAADVHLAEGEIVPSALVVELPR